MSSVMLKPESSRHTSYSLSSSEPLKFRQVPCRIREQGIYLLYLPVLLDKRVCSSNHSSSTTAHHNLFFFPFFWKGGGKEKKAILLDIVTARLITSHLITPHQSLLITISHLGRSASQCAYHVSGCVSHKTPWRGICFTQTRESFNPTRLSRERKNILSNKRKEKYPIFLFVEKGFYERIIGGIIALPHAK